MSVRSLLGNVKYLRGEEKRIQPMKGVLLSQLSQSATREKSDGETLGYTK